MQLFLIHFANCLIPPTGIGVIVLTVQKYGEPPECAFHKKRLLFYSMRKTTLPQSFNFL